MALKELVTHLGGKYTHRMSHGNSHLVLQLAMGEKWRAAAKFGVLPVMPDWLVDSALAGQLAWQLCGLTCTSTGPHA